MPRGRPLGAKGKMTIQRGLIAERAKAESDRRGEKLAKEVLNDLLFIFTRLALRYRPADDNLNKDEDRFERWAKLALDTGKALAPYQSPTYRAIMVAPAPDANAVQERRRFTLTIFEDGRKVEESSITTEDERMKVVEAIDDD